MPNIVIFLWKHIIYVDMYYIYFCYFKIAGFPRWLSGKESTCQCRRCRRRRSLEDEMATHSSILAWKKNPMNRGTLGSMGFQRVRQDWAHTRAVVIGNNTLLKERKREGGRKEKKREGGERREGDYKHKPRDGFSLWCPRRQSTSELEINLYLILPVTFLNHFT